jgi:hypothetical protein
MVSLSCVVYGDTLLIMHDDDDSTSLIAKHINFWYRAKHLWDYEIWINSSLASHFLHVMENIINKPPSIVFC